MHQRSITLEAFSEIYPQLTDVQQMDLGFWFITAGRNPLLGCVCVVQDPYADLMLFSERPLECLTEPAPRQPYLHLVTAERSRYSHAYNAS